MSGAVGATEKSVRITPSLSLSSPKMLCASTFLKTAVGSAAPGEGRQAAKAARNVAVADKTAGPGHGPAGRSKANGGGSSGPLDENLPVEGPFVQNKNKRGGRKKKKRTYPYMSQARTEKMWSEDLLELCQVHQFT